MHMSFSKLTGYECGPSNGLNNLMKQFGKDKSLQQDRFNQQGTKVNTTGFRSHKSPAQSGDKLAIEFLQQQQQQQQQKQQHKSINLIHEDWTRDFTSHDSFRYEEFEQIYQSQLPIHQWSEEFSDFTSTSRHTSSDCSEEEQIAFERVFEEIADKGTIQHYSDWDKEFENYEAGGRALSTMTLPMLYSDDTATIGETIEPSTTIPEHKHFGLTDKKWDRLKPNGLAYGYRTIHPDYEIYTPTLNNPYLKRQDDIEDIHHITLADSILALEAKTQLNPNDAKAWEKLGLKQQENERDRIAITALEKAVLIDPNCLNAWLALSIAYRNEHCGMDAYNCLEQWMINNSKYKHIVQEELGIFYEDERKRHGYITNLFLEAARTSPGEEMDSDVQVGLGLLFNMSEEYSKAIDCFKSALISRPYDYQLWNKVGATLANARDNVGAIEMYLNAIEINPSFVRARYNLAVSYMNLGQYQEAAENFLTSLSLQRNAAISASQIFSDNEKGVPVEILNNTSSNSIWDSLRLLMFMMSREDLASQCDFHNLEAFRGQFRF